jgi:hypothetical protein
MSNDWRADWSDIEAAQLDAALSASPARRLAWLEEAIEFARSVGALPKPNEEEENLGACEPPSSPRSS